MSKSTAARLKRIERQLAETAEVVIVLADFAVPKPVARREPASPESAAAPSPTPDKLDSIPRRSAPIVEPPEPLDPEPRCPSCGARCRVFRGGVTCLACMAPADPRS